MHRRSRGCRANQSAAFEISRIAPSNCAKAFGSVAVNISNPINDKKTQARRHFLLHSNLSARLWLEFEIDYVIQSQCQHVRTNLPENRFWFSAIVGRRGKYFRLIFHHLKHNTNLQFYSHTERFQHFVFIFQSLIIISDEFQSFIQCKPVSNGPVTLFGTILKTPRTRFSQYDCIFDEYAKFIGRRPHVF